MSRVRSRRRHTLALALCCGVLSWSALGRHAESALPAVGTAPPLEAVYDTEVEEIRARIEAYHTGLAEFEIDALARTLVKESRARGMSPSLVLGVIQIESGFYNFAVSSRGAMGLMQIMPATGEALAAELGLPWYGPQSLFDPLVNVRMGIAYLSRLRRDYGNLATALAAYNWGPGRISEKLRLGHPVPRLYARSVIDAYGTHAADLETAAAGGSEPTRAAAKASTASIAAPSLDR
jgi:soluble lytic murein transglycosylase-like protein